MGQTFPPPIVAADLVKANANEGKPRYSSMTDWAGGARGDDVDVASATVALANRSGGAAEADYAPRTQAAKATALGTTIVEDITRARGWIAPNAPISAKPAAPTVASISPTTAPAAQLPLTVTITGTGFTAWSTVHTGGQDTADVSGEYVSPTQMKVAIYAAAPGTVSVAVKDHDVLSNAVNFTVT